MAHTLQSLKREDLAVNHTAEELSNPARDYKTRTENKLCQFPDIFYVPVHARDNKSDYIPCPQTLEKLCQN